MDIAQITGTDVSSTGECDCGSECSWGCTVGCVLGCAIGGLLASAIATVGAWTFSLASGDTLVLASC